MSSAAPPTSTPKCPRTAAMERRSTVLSSLKDRFGRKGANTDSSPKPPAPTTSSSSSTSRTNPNSRAAASSRAAPGNPFSNPPPTRRPNNMNRNTPPNEPPPAYTPRPENNQTTTTSSSQPPVAPASTSTEDSEYTFLKSFDTIFLIDDSGSMAGRAWRESSQALETITPICTNHDSDGIDIYFLNAPASDHYRNVTEPSTVHEIFSTVRPSGGTPTGQRLNELLKPYLRRLQSEPETTKPINIIIITDGVPSDDVESVIIAAAKKLDRLEAEPWQVGIQFFQVGEEPGAAAYLTKLDDEIGRMGGGCRDIVDTVPFVSNHQGRGVGLTGEAILKVVLGAVNKRLDRRQNDRQPAPAAPIL